MERMFVLRFKEFEEMISSQKQSISNLNELLMSARQHIIENEAEKVENIRIKKLNLIHKRESLLEIMDRNVGLPENEIEQIESLIANLDKKIFKLSQNENILRGIN